MTTYREIVSKTTNLLKLNNKDEDVSRRFIIKLFQDSATMLISQRLLDRTVLNELNLYTQIPCFEFKKEEVKNCKNIEFRRCKTLMKSVCPLPKLVFSRLGASVKEIVSLDGSYRFVFLDKGQYQRNKKRQYSLKGEVYIYLDSDNHLYIPDEEIYTVDLTILTTKPEEIKNCKSCGEEEDCSSVWDTELKIPDKLISVLFTEVLGLLGVSKNTIEDQNPNGIKGN